jgi:hypothetical protein
MANRTKAADFLKAMNPESATPIAAVAAIPVAPPTAPEPEAPPKAARPAKGKGKLPARSQLKHFGGYISDATEEKIAILRARLKLDNSALITQAIDDLYRKHAAKRAFGDE